MCTQVASKQVPADCCEAHACRRKLVFSASESMSLSLSLSSDSGSIRVSTYKQVLHVTCV